MVIKRSIDARQRTIKFNLKLHVFLTGEPLVVNKVELPNYPNVENAQEVIVCAFLPGLELHPIMTPT